MRRVPLLLKIAPDLSWVQLDALLGVIAEFGLDGIIATNTTLSREGLRSKYQGESGGLSGSPLAADFLRLTIEKLREPVLAAGGVTGEEFAQAVAALQDPNTTVVAPMTGAAWGRRA